MKKLRVTVEGKIYEVLVEMLDEASAAAVPATAPAPLTTPPLTTVVIAPQATVRSAPATAGAGDVPSPLAGKLVSIDVKVGDAVVEGAQVATVEAMKMNTYIFAPKTGTVAAVLANAGDGVEEGTILLRVA
jgi:glutaconyl-CoA/methylmalonyl-CoA decarboxylase subunit gamma